MRRLGVAALCALLLVPAAGAAPKTILTQKRATAIFLANPKVANWLRHYPPKTRTTEASYSAQFEDWTIKVLTSIDKIGEVATGRVQDSTGVVTEAWTGPQVAWKMARGYPGAFGGKEINSLPIWLGFCAAFLIGLADFRRLLSLRNLDLLALVSFSLSLWYFNKGHVFTAMPLVYPPLVYLLGRMVWSGWRGRAVPVVRPVWPVWLLAAATVFLVGFRIGLNVENSNVIDVGYSGVVGAERISAGEAPYGNFPVEDSLKACGPADQDGEIRDRIQTNGRCESANPQGDTYGPVAYESYLPAYWLFGWSGKWDSLPAAHAASIAFDVLSLIGLALVGLRFGGLSLAVTLAFAWAAWPFTQYVSSSNTNDALPPLFQIGRHSPFSIWDWKQYGAGYPDLHLVQRALQVLLVIGAIAVYFLPRRKTARQLAALTAALLLGFELVLTHWFYLYLPWFFPFAAFAVLAPVLEPSRAPVQETRERPRQELLSVD